jgi:hypothetical protein
LKRWARKGYCEHRQRMHQPLFTSSSRVNSRLTGRSAQSVSGPNSVRPVTRCSNPLTLSFCMLSIAIRSRAPLRALHTTRALRNQKWPQLTNILASEIPPPVQVKSMTPAGVLLQDGRLLPSACIFLEGEVLLWDVPSTLWKDWDESKFEVFNVVVPKPGVSSSLPARLALVDA